MCVFVMVIIFRRIIITTIILQSKQSNWVLKMFPRPNTGMSMEVGVIPEAV